MEQTNANQEVVLDRQTVDGLVKLVPVFQGDFDFDAEKPPNDDCAQAIVFGWYLSRIAASRLIVDAKDFIGEVSRRVRKLDAEESFLGDRELQFVRQLRRGIRLLGRPTPTLLSVHGLSAGCLERFRNRASRVLTALLELSEMTDRGELRARIRDYDDQLVLDCAIWGVTHWADQGQRRAPTAVIEYIKKCEQRVWL